MGCGSQFGPESEDSAESLAPGPVSEPLEGQWFGDTISFELDGNQLTKWFIAGASCTAVTERAGNSEKCHIKAEVDPSTKSALEDGVVLTKVGNLIISGTFHAEGHIKGTWKLQPGECCDTEGEWEAWHKTWYETKGPPGGGSTDAADSTDGTDGQIGTDGQDGTDTIVDPSPSAPLVPNGEFMMAADATAAQKQAMERVNWYRERVGIPLMNNNAAANYASQAHAEYYVTHHKAYKENKIPGGAHSEDANYKEGFTGKSFADRMKAAGYKGSPGWEVMAFMNSPAGSVDGWVETVYHRIPILSPDAYEGGYGGAGSGAKADVMDFGRKDSKDKTLVVVYPFENQTDVPKQWGGNEWPKPPEPPNGYPSGPVITAQTSSGSTLTISTHRLLDAAGNEVPHVWHPKDSIEFMKFTWAMYSHDPLEAGATYKVMLEGTMKGKPWSRQWSFTTRK